MMMSMRNCPPSGWSSVYVLIIYHRTVSFILCICVHVWQMHVHTVCLCKDLRLAFLNHFSTFYFWDSLLQILELGLARQAGQQLWSTFFSVSCCWDKNAWHLSLASARNSGDPNSGLHTCTTGTLLSPPSLQPPMLKTLAFFENAGFCTLPIVENVYHTDILTNSLEDIGCVWLHAFKSRKMEFLGLVLGNSEILIHSFIVMTLVCSFLCRWT